MRIKSAGHIETCSGLMHCGQKPRQASCVYNMDQRLLSCTDASFLVRTAHETSLFQTRTSEMQVRSWGAMTEKLVQASCRYKTLL